MSVSFIIIFIGFAFFPALLIIAVSRHQGRVRAAWTAAADELGFVATIGGIFSKPSMAGAIDGLEVKVDVYSTGGENNSTYTRYRVWHEPVGPKVKLKRQGGLSFIRKLIGGRDIEVGDPFFDKRVIVDATDAAAVAAFLTPARRAAVLDTFSAFPRAEITQKSISVERSKADTNPRRLAQTVHRVVDIAQIMGAAEAVDAALEMREQGQLADAATELHEINRRSANSFSRMLEAEALVELGDHEQARLVLEQANDRLAGDPVYEGWKSLAHLPPPPALPPPPVPPPPALPPPPVPPPPALPPPPSRTPPPSTVSPSTVSTVPTPPGARQGSTPAGSAEARRDQQKVIDDLFDSGRMSFEVVQQFEQVYSGQRVLWIGEVASIRRYRHDSDFGEGPGTKVTVLLGTSGRSDLLSNQVHAIVELGPDVHAKRGEQLAFEGLLMRVDRFSRRLYVAKARVGGSGEAR